jgi:hypothetical protein
MPSPTRAKYIHLITARNGETETPICVAATFRGAFKIALFEQAISFPNLSERTALSIMNKMGRVFIWDSKQFEHFEEAQWSPVGKMAIIQKIPVKR